MTQADSTVKHVRMEKEIPSASSCRCIRSEAGDNVKNARKKGRVLKDQPSLGHDSRSSLSKEPDEVQETPRHASCR